MLHLSRGFDAVISGIAEEQRPQQEARVDAQEQSHKQPINDVCKALSSAYRKKLFRIRREEKVDQEMQGCCF